MRDIWAKTAFQSNSGIVVTGDNAVIQAGSLAVGTTNAEIPTGEEKPAPLPEQRQKFHLEYLNRLLTHSTVMFWVSVGFMILGGIIILTSGALIAFRDGGRDVKLVTGLSGALITTAGGVLNRQARLKEDRVTQEAGVIAAKIDEDDRFGKATALIERVDDPKLKDQLKTTAALTQLGLKPDANETAKRLLPGHRVPEVTDRPDTNDDQ
ncbi:TRADD-N-associated membrane domain-containing protein [Streptomyces barringtoniae]|uniref:TRADD-N-associated membrane domain-containing protein n=1 Tax=Streptomyces barringtoniae TaxID=2892029 RepID=UPI00201C3DFA|nr:hypothetical protein [Streptomyces barringtoniae]